MLQAADAKLPLDSPSYANAGAAKSASAAVPKSSSMFKLCSNPFNFYQESIKKPETSLNQSPAPQHPQPSLASSDFVYTLRWSARAKRNEPMESLPPLLPLPLSLAALVLSTTKIMTSKNSTLDWLRLTQIYLQCIQPLVTWLCVFFAPDKDVWRSSPREKELSVNRSISCQKTIPSSKSQPAKAG